MRNLLICLVLSITCCWADAGQIERLLRSTLSDTPNAEAVNTEEVKLQIYDSAETLTASEVESLLPLAMQCLRSSRFQAWSTGQSMFISMTRRQDGSKMLDPYLETLGNLLDGPAGPFRRGVLVILTMTAPRISPKAIAILMAHLEDKQNSAEESSGLVWALITAASSDPVILHKVLKFVAKQSESEITISALQGLHLLQPHDAEALEFIGKNLDDTSAFVREAAVNAVQGWKREVRAEFAAQLGRIAGDPEEREEVRSRAAAALRDR